MTTELKQRQSAWRVKQWCVLLGHGPTWVYQLPEEIRPPIVYVNGTPMVVEAPTDWLARVGTATRHKPRSVANAKGGPGRKRRYESDEAYAARVLEWRKRVMPEAEEERTGPHSCIAKVRCAGSGMPV